MVKKNINELVKRYTREEREEISRRYDDESVSVISIIEEFNLPINSISHLKPFLLPEISDNVCKYCGVPLQRERKRGARSNFRCNICGHIEYEPSEYDIFHQCYCSNCIWNQKSYDNEIKQAKSNHTYVNDEEIFNNNISKYLPNNGAKIHISQLDYEQKVNLGVFLNCSRKCDYNILTLRNEMKIAPMIKYEREIVVSLLEAGIINIISEKNTIKEAFSLDGTTLLTPKTLAYRLNIEYSGSELDDIINGEIGDSIDIDTIWRKIASYELIEFLNNMLFAIDWTYCLSLEHIKLFSEILQHFSVMQLAQIIIFSIQEAYYFYMSDDGDLITSHRNIIKSIEEYYEKFVSGKYECPNLDTQKYNMPDESVAAMFIYYKVLGIGDKAHTVVPTLDNLNKII